MEDFDLTLIGVTITPSSSNEDIDHRDTHLDEAQCRTKSIKGSGSGRSRKNRIVKKDRHVIQHDYHDHASDPIDFDDFVGESEQAYDKKKGGVGTPFPLKLHELLERAEVENLTDIISWQPHGRAFVVHQPKKFVAGLMPRFFRQTKLTSFQRQLNLYGFNRLTKGPDAGGYYHELFLRGRHYLTKRMVRTKIKGTGFKAASNPECEPDFYNMPPLDFDCQDESNTTHDLDYFKSFVPIVTPNEQTTMPAVTSSSIAMIPQLPLETDLGYGHHDKKRVSRGKHLPFLEPKSKIVDQDKNNLFHGKGRRDSILLSSIVESTAVQAYNNNNRSKTGTGEGQSMTSGGGGGGVFLPTSLLIASTDDQDSLSISPSIFDDTFTTEESRSLQNDNFAKATDPLAVFLDEMGDGFEDDINFGNAFAAGGTTFAAI